MRKKKVAIAGCVGLPAQYGGFETLAENLARFAQTNAEELEIIVYCSGKSYKNHQDHFAGAQLIYIPLKANGIMSMLYDVWSLIDARLRGVDEVFLLGHGGSFVLPLVKLFSRMRVLTNIDGIEWKREKWSSLVSKVLRASERFAVYHSDVVIADNEAIREYVEREFGRACEVIPYGGDHALIAQPDETLLADLPGRYALSLCRIEPENNVEMILRAFARLDHPLVFVGNWGASEYGRRLRSEYQDHANILIHEPVYETTQLRAIRERANAYIHGHSAGGTNPALVEMMHFGIPVLAHGCSFNRFTTEGKAHYFMSDEELVRLLIDLDEQAMQRNGSDMKEIACRRYTWDQIGQAYFALVDG